MKTKMLIMACLLGISGFIQAQKLNKTDVPAAVVAAAQKVNPTGAETEWEKEGDLYEAEFEINHVETAYLFKADGTYVMKEEEIDTKTLPAAVLTSAGNKAPGQKMKEASRITQANGTVTYEVEMGDDDYLFDAEGNFIGMEEEEGKEDDDEENDGKD